MNRARKKLTVFLMCFVTAEMRDWQLAAGDDSVTTTTQDHVSVIINKKHVCVPNGTLFPVSGNPNRLYYLSCLLLEIKDYNNQEISSVILI
jgi:hypothetical protein